MSYKKTLNLPRTDFPMRAGLPMKEPVRLKAWGEAGLYERMLEQRADAPTFLLHDGPPYANGKIHIGHALNKILKDIVLKYRHLAGFRTPYRPGWDCHGLPIELEVEKKLGRSKRAQMDIVDVRRLCREYADKFVGSQREEFRRLGVLGEWERPYLTTDFAYEAQEARELAAVFAGGGMYRSRKPVHWCASCRTALAEAEVDYDNHTSTSVFVAFDFAEATGPLAEFADRNPAIVIWTTTPWTLPANLAVAVHPDFEYVLVEAGERCVVIAEGLREKLTEELGLGKVLATFRGSDLENMKARHPWIDRDSLIILGDHVTLEAGSGCVHTAPGHGHEDYVVGLRYGLDVYAPVNSAGRFTPDVPEFEGQSVFEVDPKVVELLTESGKLLASESFDHSYPHCWRCKKAIIFRATEQWFLSMEETGLRQKALEEIDRVQWIPSWGRERIHGMVANRPDWCLSRQRAWGVPVIALHCKNCGTVESGEKLALHVADLFETEGADAWFSRPIAELLPEGTACGKCSGTDFERESDILDVWFDSGVSYAAVMEADHGPDTVVDLYLEGSDQHRGWFHSTLLESVATRGRAPYKAVLTHGFVLDGEGRKMSKSVGNVVSPHKVIEQYGADILRLWVAAQDYRDDLRISDEILKGLADSYRRIRNTARNLLGNLGDFDPATDVVALADLEELDRWALHRTHEFVTRCRKAYDEYEFHTVFHALNNFCSVDLSALYFDIVKDRVYCSAAGSKERRSAQSAMYRILEHLCGVIAPILCFTADEIRESMPGVAEGGNVFLTDFPVPDPAWKDDALAERWERMLEIRSVATAALEEKRQAGDIGKSLEARVEISAEAADAALLESFGPQALADMLIVSQADVSVGSELTVAVVAPRGAACGRCWKFCEDLSSVEGHDDLCGRCAGAVAALPAA